MSQLRRPQAEKPPSGNYHNWKIYTSTYCPKPSNYNTSIYCLKPSNSKKTELLKKQAVFPLSSSLKFQSNCSWVHSFCPVWNCCLTVLIKKNLLLLRSVSLLFHFHVTWVNPDLTFSNKVDASLKKYVIRAIFCMLYFLSLPHTISASWLP